MHCRQRQWVATDSSVEKGLGVERALRRRWLGRSETGVTGGATPSGGVNGTKARAAVMRYGCRRGELFEGYEPRREGGGSGSKSRLSSRHGEPPC
jgi:hypothetical protein